MRHRYLTALLALGGCLNSDAQFSSTLGDALLDTTAEPPGENCPEGGILLSIGLDENKDGFLEPDEVTQQEYICNGYNPGVPLADQTDEPPGDNCPHGGTQLDLGNDVDQDGVLDVEEISETIYLCDDPPAGGGFKVPQAVVVGFERTCAIREGGELVCWDANVEIVPPVRGEFTTIDILNTTDTCGLHADGSLECWSYRWTWEWPWVLPTGTFTAWDGHCGLRDDGTVACIDGFGLEGTYTAMSANSCGDVFYDDQQCRWYACGLRADGTVACADEASDPSVGLAPPSDRFKQISVSLSLSLSDPSAVPFACGVRTDDTLACWGNPTYIGVMPVPTGTFRSVSAGWAHACGIRTDDTVACWGAAPLSGSSRRFDQAPDGVFRQISSGRQRSCGIREDGELVCWGYCRDGECVTPPEVYR